MTDDQFIRAYLLGAHSAIDVASLEERLFTDDAFHELFEAMETELMDEYAAGALLAAERKAWEQYLAVHPESRVRLTVSRRFVSRGASRSRRRWLAPLAAAAGVVIAFLMWKPDAAAVLEASLQPGVVRSSEQVQSITLRPDVSAVRIRYERAATEAVAVSIRFIDSGAVVFRGPLRDPVPSTSLRPGDHVATLLDPGGQELEDYSFRVVKESASR